MSLSETNISKYSAVLEISILFSFYMFLVFFTENRIVYIFLFLIKF